MNDGIKRKECPVCGGSIMIDQIHREIWQHKIRKTDGRVTLKQKKIEGMAIYPCKAYCENGCMEWSEEEFVIDEFGHFIDLKEI